MIKEGSFTARMYISGYPLTCRLGFQELETRIHVSDNIYNSTSTRVLNYVKTYHLCANTGKDSIAVLFHFELVGNSNYIITSRDSNFFFGHYLGITEDFHVNAYQSRSESSNFSFKKNGKYLLLSDMENNIASDVEMVCRDGGIEFHNNVVFKSSRGNEWSAFIRTKNGSAGLVGNNITLTIEERDVE